MANDAGGVRPGDTPGLVRSLPARAGWLVLGVAFVVHLREWTFICDDAYISFRYAQNLAHHGALVFNVDPMEYVEGYTNLLWVLVLALGEWMGITAPTLAPVLTALAAMASLVFVVWLVRSLRARFDHSARFGVVDLVPAGVLVALPEFVVWGSGGLETSLALALVLAAMLAWVQGRLEGAAVLAALAGLTRLDALLPIAGFGLAWLVVFGFARQQEASGAELPALPWRRLAVAALVFASPLVAQFVWRHAYYGEWLPNTWAIKQHGRLLAGTVGSEYVASWAANVHVWWFAPLLVGLRPRHALFVVPLLVVVYYARSVGGDFMGYSRFLLPATALLAGLVGWLLADLQAWFDRRVPRPAPLAIVLGVALVVGLAWDVPARALIDEQSAWIPARRGDEKGKWEGVHGMDEFARVRLAAGSWMRENLPPDTLVSVGAAGAMPYASGLPSIDAYGLVDPGVLAVAKPVTGPGARPGHQFYAPLAYIQSREPGLMCHIGYAGLRRPSRSAARQRAGRDYVWACIDLGAIDDAQGPVDARYYCCLRDRNRVVGPFGAEDGS